MTRWERLRTWAWSPKAKIVVAIVLVLCAFRMALPWIVKSVVNDRLARMEGYTGYVADVDIALVRGAYTLNELTIEQIDREVPVPFLHAERVDISLEWLALLQGRVVAELVFERPVLNFVGGRHEQTGKENDWRSTVDDLVPITINHLAVHDGEVHYRDFSRRPEVDVVASALEVEAVGLSTTERETGSALPAHIDVQSNVQRSGRLHASVDLDPWREQPTFDLAVALEDLPAAQLNQFLRAYAGIDAEAGEFYCYSEISARDGRFEGYVKPMIEHLSLFRFGEEGDVGQAFADVFFQVVQDLFENQGTDRFATRVEVSGSFVRPDVDGLQAVIGVLYNAFIRAFEHGIDRPREAWQLDTSRSPVQG